MHQRHNRFDPETATETHRSRHERKREVRDLRRSHAQSAGGFAMTIMQTAIIPVLLGVILFCVLYALFGIKGFE